MHSIIALFVVCLYDVVYPTKAQFIGQRNCGKLGNDCGKYQACLRPPLVDDGQERCVNCDIKRTDCGTDKELLHCNIYCQDEIRRMYESKIKSLEANFRKNVSMLTMEKERLQSEIKEYSCNILDTKRNPAAIAFIVLIFCIVVAVLSTIVWLICTRRYKLYIFCNRNSSRERHIEDPDPPDEDTCLMETFNKEGSIKYEELVEDSGETRNENNQLVGSKPVGDGNATGAPVLEHALEDKKTLQDETTADDEPVDGANNHDITDGENNKDNKETNITIFNTDTTIDCDNANAQTNEMPNVGNGIINNTDRSHQNTHSNQNGVNNQHHQHNGNLGQSTADDYGHAKLTTVPPVERDGTHTFAPSSARVLPPTK